MHEVVECAAIEDLTAMAALSQVRANEDEQRKSMARTKAAARKQM